MTNHALKAIIMFALRKFGRILNFIVGGDYMAVQSTGEHYKCLVCGNEIRVIRVGGGTLVCCGQDMKLIDVRIPKPIDDEIPGSL